MSARRTKTTEPSAASLREVPEVTDGSKARRNPYARGGRARILDADLAQGLPRLDERERRLARAPRRPCHRATEATTDRLA
jgi:hypothetical protein